MNSEQNADEMHVCRAIAKPAVQATPTVKPQHPTT
jgi:hypothetical protein